MISTSIWISIVSAFTIHLILMPMQCSTICLLHLKWTRISCDKCSQMRRSCSSRSRSISYMFPNGMSWRQFACGKIWKMILLLTSTSRTTMQQIRPPVGSISLMCWILYIQNIWDRLWHMHHSKDLQLMHRMLSSTISRPPMSGLQHWITCLSNHVSALHYI